MKNKLFLLTDFINRLQNFNKDGSVTKNETLNHKRTKRCLCQTHIIILYAVRTCKGKTLQSFESVVQQ